MALRKKRLDGLLAWERLNLRRSHQVFLNYLNAGNKYKSNSVNIQSGLALGEEEDSFCLHFFYSQQKEDCILRSMRIQVMLKC